MGFFSPSNEFLHYEETALFWLLFVLFGRYTNVWSYLVWCTLFGIIHVKSPSQEWARGEILAGCLSNLLYLIRALNQDPQPTSSAFQSQLHFSIQMVSMLFSCCASVHGTRTMKCDLCVGWNSNESHRRTAWWVSSLFLVNPNSQTHGSGHSRTR